MSTTFFSNLNLLAKDPIIGLTEEFNSDKRIEKINLGVGIYLNEYGLLPTLDCIKSVLSFCDFSSKGYLPIDGSRVYCDEVKKLLFGEKSNSDETIVTFQSLGGTGALRLGAELIKSSKPNTIVAISNPSWENHRSIFESAGLNVVTYSYFDNTRMNLDIPKLIYSLENLPEQSIVVFHACCHNPTGMDPKDSDWDEIINVVEQKKHIPFLDLAYQGFSRGITEDATVIRKFASKIRPTFIANSFSKSLSLYGERVGALTLATNSSDETKKTISNVKKIIRSNYSNPPTFGQNLVTSVLTDNNAKKLWDTELGYMRKRIKKTRNQLVELLLNNNVNRDFSHISLQNGMFSYSGLTKNEVKKLKTDYGIYIVESGRICVAAINEKNIHSIASALNSVLKS